MLIASYIANYRCGVCLESVPYHQMKSGYAPVNIVQVQYALISKVKYSDFYELCT